MDKLKEISKQLGGRIIKQNLSDINFIDISARKLVVKNYRGYALFVDDFNKIYFAKIKVNCEFSISINNSNKLSSIDQLIDHSFYNLYIFKKSYSDFLTGHRYNPFLNERFKVFWKTFNDKIIKLNLLSDETISIREDGIGLALHADRDLILILDDVIDSINDSRDIFKSYTKVKIFKKNIPENLKTLYPLLKKWAIPDDGERELIINSLSNIQKNKLVNTVDPFIGQINEFLDSFSDHTFTEEAILFENLAELISELKIG